MSKRPLTPLVMAVPATKGAAYVPEPIGKDSKPQAAVLSAPTLSETPKQQVSDMTTHLGDVTPKSPAAMNFKLTPEAGLALRAHHFKTGRSKQAIVEEALNQWLKKNSHLI